MSGEVYRGETQDKPVTKNKNWGAGVAHQLEEYNPFLWESAMDFVLGRHWYSWVWRHTADDPLHIPMIFRAFPGTRQWEDAMNYVDKYWRKDWYLFNEPTDKNQSNLTGTQAATIVRAFRAETAHVRPKIGIPGFLLAWPDRYKAWLIEYLGAGGDVPDIWTVHLYGYSGGDVTNQLDEFCEFLEELGVGTDKPIHVTEAGSWFDEEMRQLQVMHACKGLLDAGRVERVLWFSGHVGTIPKFEWWKRSDLLDIDGNMTRAGAGFVELDKPVHTVFMPMVIGGIA